jgi:hypothetical protein
MKLRNIAFVAAAVVLPTGMILSTSGLASAASAKTFAFKGSVSSTIKGTITATPGLTLTASTGTVKLVTKGTLSSLKGTNGTKLKQSNTKGSTTLTGGSYTSTVTLPAGSTCISLESGLPTAKGTLTWKSTVTGTGLPAANSIITFGKASAAIGTPIVVTEGGTGTTTTGSFAKPTPANSLFTLTIDQTESALLTDCGSATGLTSLSFKGVNGKSTAAVG